MPESHSEKQVPGRSTEHDHNDGGPSTSGNTQMPKRTADGELCNPGKHTPRREDEAPPMLDNRPVTNEDAPEGSRQRDGSERAALSHTLFESLCLDSEPPRRALAGSALPGRRTLSETRVHHIHENNRKQNHRRSKVSLAQLMSEVSHSWFLNLISHLPDRRYEKYFFTYIQRPNCWRRITITWNYRHVCPHSFHKDLRSLALPGDKSLRIYKEIRHALRHQIFFFDTVTELRLHAEQFGQLHIEVAEDAEEAFAFPSLEQVSYMHLPCFGQSEIVFEGFISGFIYRVRVHGQVLVKKDLPRPDSIDEFMYELNALYALRGSHGVVRLHGLVTDDAKQHIRGMLMAYGSEGSLFDILYDAGRSGQRIPWARRRRWARDLLLGLANVHEAGFVQGDLTLCNAVVDDNDDAVLIDFNRRGCPLGWEPPELDRALRRQQKVGLMIGVKTDLFQLGMCLRGLAAGDCEPEKLRGVLDELRDLSGLGVPEWFKSIVGVCLEEDPRRRVSAEELARMFDEGLDAEERDAEAESVRGAEKARVDDNGVLQSVKSPSLRSESPPLGDQDGVGNNLDEAIEYICSEGGSRTAELEEEDNMTPQLENEAHSTAEKMPGLWKGKGRAVEVEEEMPTQYHPMTMQPDWGFEAVGSPAREQEQGQEEALFDLDLCYVDDCDRFLQ